MQLPLSLNQAVSGYGRKSTRNGLQAAVKLMCPVLRVAILLEDQGRFYSE